MRKTKGAKDMLITVNNAIVYIIFIVMVVEGFIQMATGKTFFFNTDKYDAESLKQFSQKSGIGVVFLGLGAIIFSYGTEAEQPVIWAIITGLVLILIGFINYSICHKKYLRNHK